VARRGRWLKKHGREILGGPRAWPSDLGRAPINRPSSYDLHVLKVASLLVGTWALVGAVAAPLTVRDIDGRTWTPLQPASGQIHLLVFISAECPISNRYAPEIDRIAASYRPKHVQSFLVHGSEITNEAICQHQRFHPGLSAAVVIVKVCSSRRRSRRTSHPRRIYTVNGRMYRGRIDDLYLNAGQSRRSASHHDLRDALDAVLSRRPVAPSETRAVGCFIQRGF
jgi:hypothetical protein